MKSIILFIMALGLVGCASTQVQTQYVNVPTYTPVTAELLEPCVMKAVVPEKNEYVQSTDVQKQVSLVKYSKALIADWQVCASKVKAISLENEARIKNSQKDKK